MRIVLLFLLLSGCSFSPHKGENIAWPEELRTACENLASAYPLSSHSPREASVASFDRYFSSAGLIRQYEQTLVQQASIPPEVIDHIKLVKSVRDVFYADSSTNASLKIKIKTLRAPPQLQHVRLYLGTHVGPHMLGPRIEHHYTLSANSEPLTIKALRFDNTRWSKTFEGNWSLFHFLDSGLTAVNGDGSIVASIPIGDSANFEYSIQGLASWQRIRRDFSCP